MLWNIGGHCDTNVGRSFAGLIKFYANPYQFAKLTPLVWIVYQSKTV